VTALGIVALVGFALIMAYEVGVAVERGRHARESLRIRDHVTRYVDTISAPKADG
jgi:hypothetical protein